MGRLTEFFGFIEDLDNRFEDDYYTHISLEKGSWNKKYKTSLIRARNKEIKRLEKENKE